MMNILVILMIVSIFMVFIILWSWVLLDGIGFMFNFFDWICSFFRKKQVSLGEKVIKMIEEKKGNELLMPESFYLELIKNNYIDIDTNSVFGVPIKIV